ncbi:LysR family transcriptional regulator [Paraburkholderia phenoliruptrix]|uniref:LysR family transcriptional regulator n=1 Tax=Paraburkholderia phenoliruptrix TaxID=252970 RepID=UPI001C4F7243|nr:LysR family transcriptional regulator [Paraburkholderia phenoliruptrix]MBW9100226.1 LysR family transcriptional regulator [Paraburkholderia phenoliruptrix]
MDVITHVRTFAAVVQHGSFAEAARELGVAPSVVARRIGQLETELNTRLFERTTRSVALTEAGERFHVRAAGLVGEFDDLIASVERDAGNLQGPLRVMSPTTLTMRELAPIYCAFLREHPQITLEIALVDHSANPAESGFDLCISGRLASYDGVVDIPLKPVQPLLCASPEYLASHPAPVHPRELFTHDCLVFSGTGTSWQFQSQRGTVSVDVRPRLQADDNVTLLCAVRNGLGLALLPYYVVREALANNELVEVMPEYKPQENFFKAYVPRRRVNVARVGAFIDWLTVKWAGANDAPAKTA